MLIDVNILLYAYVRDYPEHERTKVWLEQVLSGPQRIGIPWANLLAFMRLVTNPRIFNNPASPQSAWIQVQDWLACDNVWIPNPTDGHAAALDSLIKETQTFRSELVPDLHLAALAIEHNLTVCSCDSDFGKLRRYAGSTRSTNNHN